MAVGASIVTQHRPSQVVARLALDSGGSARVLMGLVASGAGLLRMDARFGKVPLPVGMTGEAIPAGCLVVRAEAMAGDALGGLARGRNGGTRPTVDDRRPLLVACFTAGARRAGKGARIVTVVTRESLALHVRNVQVTFAHAPPTIRNGHRRHLGQRPLPMLHRPQRKRAADHNQQKGRERHPGALLHGRPPWHWRHGSSLRRLWLENPVGWGLPPKPPTR